MAALFLSLQYLLRLWRCFTATLQLFLALTDIFLHPKQVCQIFTRPNGEIEMSVGTPLAEDYVTIIAPSIAEAMAQFRARGLAAAGYAIVGPVDRHRFTLATGTGSIDLFAESPMVAATFRRAAAR
jgi:hypothetical protein